MPRTSARAPTCVWGPGGLPACHGAESTKKDPRPEGGKNAECLKKHIFIFIYSRLPFREWGVPLVVTQAGLPQIDVDVTSECRFLVLTVSKIGDIFDIAV